MKSIKTVLMIMSGLTLFMFANFANGQNERNPANSNTGKEVRYKEDIVKNPELYVVDVSGNNKASMSSQSVRDKNTTPATVAVQVLQNDPNVIRKYKKSPFGIGDNK